MRKSHTKDIFVVKVYLNSINIFTLYLKVLLDATLSSLDNTDIMPPKKAKAVTAGRVRLPRAVKDNSSKTSEPIAKTTPKTIKKTTGGIKKAVPAKISTAKARGVKRKGKEKKIATPEVPSASVLNDEIIRQEANYPNPFSTESSRRNTAALLSQWDSTKSPGFLPPESEKQVVDGVSKSTSSRSAKSKHEAAYAGPGKEHIAIPSPAPKVRCGQTSQLFDANKEQRLKSLAEGKFPDPTYPQASIDNGTESSPGFNEAMGFKYSPGFGGPQGLNTSPRNQMSFDARRNSSAAFGAEGSQKVFDPVRNRFSTIVPGTSISSLPAQTQPADSTNSTDQTNLSADTRPSTQFDGGGRSFSSYQDPYRFPMPFIPDNWKHVFADVVDGRSPNWPHQNQAFRYFNPADSQQYNPMLQNHANNSSRTGPQMPPSFSSMYSSMRDKNLTDERSKQFAREIQDQDWMRDFIIQGQRNHQDKPGDLMHGHESHEFGSIPYPPGFPYSIRPEETIQPPTAGNGENITMTEDLEPSGIKESRMTREKTVFVQGGKIIKTTTMIFTPSDEEKKKSIKVDVPPEDKIGIVVVDKEGNVDVESGDWLHGFDRIEGWEVDALLNSSNRLRRGRNRNGVTRKGTTKKSISKKPLASKKVSSPTKIPTPSKPKTPEPIATGHPESFTLESRLDFIPFDFPDDPVKVGTQSRPTRISKQPPKSTKEPTEKKASPAKKASASPSKTASKATTSKIDKPASVPTRSLRSASSPAIGSSAGNSKAPVIPDEAKREAPSKTQAPKPRASKNSATPKTAAKPSAEVSPSEPKSKPRAVKQGPKQRARRPSIWLPVDSTELEKQIESRTELANQAAENMVRHRGKAAEQAAKDFQEHMDWAEKGRKELEGRKRRGKTMNVK